MIVQCPSCAAKFRVADDKIKPQGVKVRCGRCKTVFRVRRADESGPRPAPVTAPVRRPSPAPILDEQATRVVHDPVGEALDEFPSGIDSPLLRTGQSPRGTHSEGDAFASSPGDPLAAAAAASSPGSRRLTEPPRGSLLGFEATSLSDNRLQTAVAKPETKPGDRRSGWLISSSERELESGGGDAPPELQARSRPGFRPAVTDEHAPRRTALSEALRFEAPVDAAARRPGRRDALASLADPMPADTLDWDVEGETAPRHTFDTINVDDLDDLESDEPRTAPPTPVAPPAPALRAAAEPTPPPPAEGESGPQDSALESFTFSHRVIARDERLAVWLGTALGILLALVGFATFLAAKNDWLLDLAELDQMLGVAFAGESYTPRQVRTVRVYELEGVRIEEPLAVPDPLAEGLQIGNLAQSLYRTQAEVPLLLIEGDLLNHDDQPHRAVFIVGRLLDEGVEVVAVTVPVGRTLSQEELETIHEPASLDRLYATVAEEAAALVIQPNQRSRFSLVFPDFEGDRGDAQLSYVVEIARTEQENAEGDWLRVEYQPEEGGPAEP